MIKIYKCLKCEDNYLNGLLGEEAIFHPYPGYPGNLEL